MQDVLDKLEHQMTKLRKDIQHHKKRAAKSMQAAFTLGWASHVLEKFTMDDALFPPERKDAVYDEGNLLPVYSYVQNYCPLALISLTQSFFFFFF